MADGLRVTSNAADVAAFFGAAAGQVQPRAVALVSHWGVRLQAQVKANASGRPGPRVITGDYNRSIALDIAKSGQPTARVGTNRPQGRRLELGFKGVDSLGRHYNQPPYAHFGPAYDTIAPQFEEAAANLILDVLGG